MFDDDDVEDNATMGEAMLDYGDPAIQLKEDQGKINELIDQYGIEPEDRQEFTEAYFNEKYPTDTTLGLYPQSPRTMDEIVAETKLNQAFEREQQQVKQVRSAQQTLTQSGASLLDDLSPIQASLLDYMQNRNR